MQNVLKLFYSPNQNTEGNEISKSKICTSQQDKYIVGFALWDLSPLRFLLLGTSVWTHFSEISLGFSVL